MVQRSDFPNDDDGEVLFQLAVKGINLGIKRKIDFSCYAKDQETAKNIIDDLSTYGYDSRIFIYDEQDGPSDISVYASITMLPDYTLLIIEQERLNAILGFHGTLCDGWVTESSN
jgi:Regulator of ribonuclease activity B